MRLTAPIYRLKRQARRISREESVPLHIALDRLALKEGFASWSLLASSYATEAPAGRLYSAISAGDLVLLGARPGHGKTLLGLELAVEAMKGGHKSYFFSLEYTARECFDRLTGLGIDMAPYEDRFVFDGSDEIDADYIVGELEQSPPGSFVIVDFLQLLDQRRKSPPLGEQIYRMQTFAKARQITFIFLSQIDRSFDSTKGFVPGMSDVRLPNPLDLSVFDHACFLNDGDVSMSRVVTMGNLEP